MGRAAGALTPRPEIPPGGSADHAAERELSRDPARGVRPAPRPWPSLGRWGRARNDPAPIFFSSPAESECANLCRPPGRRTGQFAMAELLLGWPLERPAPEIGFRPLPMPEHDVSRPLRDAAESHVLVIAPTGAGKGRSVIIPNLLHYDGPAIVVDVKGEAAFVTARHRREIGQEVVVLDPFGVLSTQTGSLNPLDLLAATPGSIADDAFMLAEMIAGGSRGTKEPFWDDHAVNLVAGLIAHVMTTKQPDDRNLGSVWKLLAHDDLVLHLATQLDAAGGDKPMHPFVHDQFANFLNHEGDKVRTSVRS